MERDGHRGWERGVEKRGGGVGGREGGGGEREGQREVEVFK